MPCPMFHRGSVSVFVQGGLCPGGPCLGDLCPGVSVKGVSVWHLYQGVSVGGSLMQWRELESLYDVTASLAACSHVP